MGELELPELLAGPWEHALMLSYGLDLPFYERAIAGQLPDGCRNRVLLGDERTYLASCDHYAASGLVRDANRRYVAEPILRSARSHAKVILLTAPHAGRLLVGSGNLSLQGFGSGGELFTQYEYADSDRSCVAEFAAVRALVERLRDGGSLTRTTAWHIDRMLEATPWLYRSADANASRVRHNLDRSFSDQLAEAIGNERVEELWLAAPFFDERAAALTSLIGRLRPTRTVLFVQPGHTEIDPTLLQALVDRRTLEVRPFERADLRDLWVHAKLVVARSADSAVCLQGSPNLSIAAMGLTDPEGNLEVANLLHGARDAFDGILDGLEIAETAVDVASLRLTAPEYEDEPDRLEEVGWRLTGAEWADGILRMSYRGLLPQFDVLRVLVDDIPLAAKVRTDVPGALDLAVTLDSGEPVGAGGPVRLLIDDGDPSNAVFPCERATLHATLESTEGGDQRLARLGDLDLGDDELEQLLAELEAALVIDQRSLWQLAGRPEKADVESDNELRLAYEDVDFELLRTHPKMRQYLLSGGGHGGARSRLQIVLNSITSAFADLLQPDDVEAAITAATEAVAGEGDSPEATVEDEEDAPRARWSAQTRINVLLRNFIRRYLAGLGSEAFQEIAGPRVMAQNHVIFLHFLERLSDRDWIDQDFILDATARTIGAFWGDRESDGYVARLDEQQLEEVLALVRGAHGDAQLLATLYEYAVESRLLAYGEMRARVRDVWLGWLERGRFAPEPRALAEACVLLRGFAPPDGPTPAELIDELRVLAEFTTRSELAALVTERLGIPTGACYFARENVRRRGRDVTVDCLTMEHDEVVLGLEDAQWALARWTRAEPLEHHRVAVRTRDGVRPRFVAFFEPREGRGRYAMLESDSTSVELAALPSPDSPWDNALLAFMVAADAAGDEPLTRSA